MALLQLSLEDPPEYLPLIRLFCVEACGLSGAYVRKPLSLTAWQTHFATGKHHDCVRDHYTNWFQDRSSVHSLLAEEEGYYDMAMDSPPSTISQFYPVASPPSTISQFCPEEYYPDDDDYLDEEVLETGSVMWHPPGTTLISLPEYRTTAGPSNATQPPPSVPVVLPPLPPPLPTPGVEIKGNSFFSPTGGLFRCLKILPALSISLPPSRTQHSSAENFHRRFKFPIQIGHLCPALLLAVSPCPNTGELLYKGDECRIS